MGPSWEGREDSTPTRPDESTASAMREITPRHVSYG